MLAISKLTAKGEPTPAKNVKLQYPSTSIARKRAALCLSQTSVRAYLFNQPFNNIVRMMDLAGQVDRGTPCQPLLPGRCGLASIFEIMLSSRSDSTTSAWRADRCGSG